MWLEGEIHKNPKSSVVRFKNQLHKDEPADVTRFSLPPLFKADS